MDRFPPILSNCFMVSSFFLIVLVSRAREFSYIFACSAALLIYFSISRSFIIVMVLLDKVALGPLLCGSLNKYKN